MMRRERASPHRPAGVGVAEGGVVDGAPPELARLIHAQVPPTGSIRRDDAGGRAAEGEIRSEAGVRAGGRGALRSTAQHAAAAAAFFCCAGAAGGCAATDATLTSCGSTAPVPSVKNPVREKRPRTHAKAPPLEALPLAVDVVQRRPLRTAAQQETKPTGNGASVEHGSSPLGHTPVRVRRAWAARRLVPAGDHGAHGQPHPAVSVQRVGEELARPGDGDALLVVELVEAALRGGEAGAEVG